MVSTIYIVCSQLDTNWKNFHSLTRQRNVYTTHRIASQWEPHNTMHNAHSGVFSFSPEQQWNFPQFAKENCGGHVGCLCCFRSVVLYCIVYTLVLSTTLYPLAHSFYTLDSLHRPYTLHSVTARGFRKGYLWFVCVCEGVGDGDP